MNGSNNYDDPFAPSKHTAPTGLPFQVYISLMEIKY